MILFLYYNRCLPTHVSSIYCALHGPGGLSIAIPGEIKGYWTAYKKFGRGIPWKDIFSPIISMCEHGIPVNERLAGVLLQKEEFVKSHPEFR